MYTRVAREFRMETCAQQITLPGSNDGAIIKR